MSAQVAGLVTASVGATFLWSPWALVIAGLLLVVVPEIVRAIR